MSSIATPKPDQGTIFGHPKGLAFLFFTEMWERFSFYGMRSLLVVYMVNFLFLQPDVGQSVLGFNALKALFQPGKLDVQPLASTVYGLYTGFVYLTPFIGGLLADRVLGRRRSVILGAVLMAIGHFLMAIQSLFFPALMFLILGNGAFKPNISTQVGALYAAGDPRRDRAFSIFYVGINIGAFFSPLVCGTLGQMGTNTYHWGFGVAGIGMLVGLGIYLYGQRYLDSTREEIDNRSLGSTLWKTVIGYSLLTPVMIVLMILVQASPMWFKAPVAALVLIAAIWWLVRLSAKERPPVVALCVLCFCTIFFWATYEQQGNTVQIWADKYTDLRIVKSADARSVRVEDPKEADKIELQAGEVLANSGEQYYAVKGGIVDPYKALDAERKPLLDELDATKKQSEAAAKRAVEESSKAAADEKTQLDQKASDLQDKVGAIDRKVSGLMGTAIPSTWFQSFNPFLIFTLTPFITWFWARQARKKKEPSTAAKMAWGGVLIGLSYVVMVVAASGAGTAQKTGLLWLFGFSVVITLGELYFSPIGLSLVTKLAPARMVSMLMGVWFLATFVGNNLAGYLGTFFNVWSKPMFFGVVGAIVAAISLVIFAILRPLHKAIGGSEESAGV